MLKKSSIKKLIIHCSDTDDTLNIGAREIHKMHLNFGWDGIGYHKVVCRDGSIEIGRPEYWIGAHVKGLNDCSLGVCLIGRNKFTEFQFNSLHQVLLEWKSKYRKAKILGHSESTSTSKTCPNFDVQVWCKKRGLI